MQTNLIKVIPHLDKEGGGGQENQTRRVEMSKTRGKTRGLATMGGTGIDLCHVDGGHANNKPHPKVKWRGFLFIQTVETLRD